MSAPTDYMRGCEGACMQVIRQVQTRLQSRWAVESGDGSDFLRHVKIFFKNLKKVLDFVSSICYSIVTGTGNASKRKETETMKYSVKEIVKMFEENNWKETKITCPDGESVYVTPCSYADEITDVAQCDYFLCASDIPWMGSSSIDQLVHEINEHASLKAELDDERAKLRAYFDKHQKDGWDDDSWSWYSDWHKDCYGYRPHGYVCGEYIEPYKGACLRW